MKYVPQLDSLRALAVFLVINTHWLGGFWRFGQHGVMIFFVLSGFLITYILLDVTKHSNNKLKSIRQFVIRRALRIFPIYYLFILFFFFAGIPFMKENFLWFATYTSNIKYFLLGEFPEGLFSHLWSLAVEEQFYLFWPFLILFLRTKYITSGISLVVILGMVSRVFFYIYGNEFFNSNFSYTLTTSYFDTLGIGALLAYYLYNNTLDLTKMKPIKIGILALVFFSLYVTLSYTELRYARLFFMNLLFALSTASFILFLIAAPKENLINRLFKLDILIFVGKISYGLYLYHKVIPWLIGYSCSKLQLTTPSSLNLYLVSLVFLFAITIASFYLVELPLNKLKTRFKYY